MAEPSLKSAINLAMKAAMKARDKQRLGAIRLILAEIKRIEVDERVEIDDQRVLAILDKMLKQRRDSHSQYQAAGRSDLADQEAFEMDVIQTFLPSALEPAALARIIDDAVASTGASSMRDMGKIMSAIRPQLQGRADMGAVSKLVKQRLQ